MTAGKRHSRVTKETRYKKKTVRTGKRHNRLMKGTRHSDFISTAGSSLMNTLLKQSVAGREGEKGRARARARGTVRGKPRKRDLKKGREGKSGV